ncbi:hypothetical protein PPTG_21251 [Phytophthora nicotianae INRA-310]|uniref:Uncharacterized protein n=3 Tax=Phytophthora nicotianae TaxID=4792 RepID=W2R489_PHYN3|nr:hypothetical protein PPTG_21251 [Phytophthora nicotianae INRA-310]ETM41512.1 hypothetical protein L914_12721 [Phytophthora nicotianae]ETN20198.1 hypothetical protein PPTG_21251 [Phytophthora nicotianae INRA-310]ETO70203.1 hypothetical protein F444_13293 [Phytophthora nicotianae P1976]
MSVLPSFYTPFRVPGTVLREFIRWNNYFISDEHSHGSNILVCSVIPACLDFSK